MQNGKYGLLLAGLLFLTACSTVKVSIDYDDQAAFSRLQTYNWLPGQPKKSGNHILDSDQLLHERMRRTIDSNFRQRGYLIQEVETADFLVGYYLVTEDKTRVTVIDDYYGYPRGWGYYGPYYGYGGGVRSYAYEYTLGTLIIDIVNRESHKLMWRGTAQDEIKNLKTPEQKKAKIAEVVHKVLAQFPPDVSSAK